MRRRRRKKGSDEVQINLAAMLDMAFQLLAFFILTFRPAPIEGHFQLHMPPAIQQADPKVDPNAPETPGTEASAFVNSLDMFVTADTKGQVTSISVGRTQVVTGKLTAPSVQKLYSSLKAEFGAQATPFERIQLHVDKKLHYEELMKIIDVCTRQTLPDGSAMKQVGFTELKDGGESPSE